MVASVSAEIRVDGLSTASSQFYRYASLQSIVVTVRRIRITTSE
jgi:hypothetical protein